MSSEAERSVGGMTHRLWDRLAQADCLIRSELMPHVPFADQAVARECVRASLVLRKNDIASPANHMRLERTHHVSYNRLNFDTKAESATPTFFDRYFLLSAAPL
jgi:hypothetical protein